MTQPRYIVTSLRDGTRFYLARPGDRAIRPVPLLFHDLARTVTDLPERACRYRSMAEAVRACGRACAAFCWPWKVEVAS